MKLRYPKSLLNLVLSVLTLVPFVVGTARGGEVFNESFDRTEVPAGWTIEGDSDGTAKGDSDWFGGGQGYLRMTEDADSERSTAFYTQLGAIASQDWTITAEIREAAASDHADGIGFAWVDSSTVSPTADDLDGLMGGYGNNTGVPQGGNSGDSDGGYHAGLEGFAVQFRHASGNADWIVPRDLRAWGGSEDDYTKAYGDHFSIDGWVPLQIDYDADVADNNLTVAWGGSHGSYSHTASWTLPIDFDGAYFGVGAGTGAHTASHDIQNFKLTGTAVPEPGSGLLVGIGVLAALVLAPRRYARR